MAQAAAARWPDRAAGVWGLGDVKGEWGRLAEDDADRGQLGPLGELLGVGVDRGLVDDGADPPLSVALDDRDLLIFGGGVAAVERDGDAVSAPSTPTVSATGLGANLPPVVSLPRIVPGSITPEPDLIVALPRERWKLASDRRPSPAWRPSVNVVIWGRPCHAPQVRLPGINTRGRVQ